MFDVYCEGHGSNVLLGFGQILGVTNGPDAIELRWRCYEGHEGTWLVPRRSSAAHELHAA